MGALCHSRMQRRWPAGIVNVFVCVSILLNLFSLFLNWIKNRINRDPSAITQDNNKRNVHVVHFTNKPAPLPPSSLQTHATHNEWTNFVFSGNENLRWKHFCRFICRLVRDIQRMRALEDVWMVASDNIKSKSSKKKYENILLSIGSWYWRVPAKRQKPKEKEKKKYDQIDGNKWEEVPDLCVTTLRECGRTKGESWEPNTKNQTENQKEWTTAVVAWKKLEIKIEENEMYWIFQCVCVFGGLK